MSQYTAVVRGILEPDKNGKNNKKQRLIAFAMVPFVLAVPPVVGWALGCFLDDLFGSSPYLMYFFVVLGFVAAYREFCRVLRDFGE